MQYFRSLIPANSPFEIDPNDELRQWQERSLHVLLIGLFVIAGLIALLLIGSSTQSNNWTLFLRICIPCSFIINTFCFTESNVSCPVNCIVVSILHFLDNCVYTKWLGWCRPFIASLFLLSCHSFPLSKTVPCWHWSKYWHTIILGSVAKFKSCSRYRTILYHTEFNH